MSIGGISKRWAAVAAVACLTACSAQPKADGGFAPPPANDHRPNILVIEVDHLGVALGAYGDLAAETPNIDHLAQEGVRFDAAYAASGGEDAETAALLTGMHPSTIGMVQEWTGVGAWRVVPPPEIRAYPELVRAAGYETFHVGARPDPFGAPVSLWSVADITPGALWPNGTIRQPFLGVVDLSTLDDRQQKDSGFAFWRTRDDDASPETSGRAVTVPADLPDTGATRAALLAEKKRIRHVDDQVGQIIARLERAHLLDHTIVVFTAKTGPARPRAERTVYDAGVHVPLIVRWPDGRGRGTARRDLVSGIDLAPSILRMAGVAPRAWMQGRDHLTTAQAPNTFVFTVQNRVDDVYERVFAVRDGRYLYTLNLAPYTPVLSLARAGPLKDAVAAARKNGGLSRGQQAAFTDERDEAELYDLRADPQALNNLASDPKHGGDVARLAQVLNAFAAEAPDYSTWTARDLGDLFRPGGVTPTTAAPRVTIVGGTMTMTSLTPGAAILWRTGDDERWSLYAGPVKATDKPVQAVAVRYGFLPGATATAGRRGL
jgi:arylsulfatase A-like enzyme